MTTAIIREKLHRYIENANDKKVKAIFTILEEELDELSMQWYDDEDFVDELKRSEKAYLDGKEKGYTLEQVLERGREVIKKIHRK
jgi:hypothetical protein